MLPLFNIFIDPLNKMKNTYKNTFGNNDAYIQNTQCLGESPPANNSATVVGAKNN